MECTFTIAATGEIKNRETVGDFFRQHQVGTYTLVSKTVNIRSLGQNAYYWYIVLPIVRKGLYNIGFDEIKSNDQAHEFLKNKFLKKYVHNKNNPEEVIEMPGSTAELTTVQFMAYIAEIQKFSAEWLGEIIPDPGQRPEIDYPNEK